MSDRETQRLDFLKAAGLADAMRTPLAGDASTRRYERLTAADGRKLILMDQAPAEESAVAPEDADADQRRALGYNAEARLAGGSVAASSAAGAAGSLHAASMAVLAQATTQVRMMVLKFMAASPTSFINRRYLASDPLGESMRNRLGSRLFSGPSGPNARISGT